MQQDKSASIIDYSYTSGLWPRVLVTLFIVPSCCLSPLPDMMGQQRCTCHTDISRIQSVLPARIPRTGCLPHVKCGKACRRRSLRTLALWRPWCVAVCCNRCVVVGAGLAWSSRTVYCVMRHAHARSSVRVLPGHRSRASPGFRAADVRPMGPLKAPPMGLGTWCVSLQQPASSFPVSTLLLGGWGGMLDGSRDGTSRRARLRAWGNQFLWGYKESMDAELQEVFNFAVSNGVNLWDTADSYGASQPLRAPA